MLAIRLPQSIEKRLERLARLTGRTKTYYVREAILEHLEDIEDLYLAVDRAIPCGLILNELITNARKHAFPEGRAGVVRVELRQTASNRFVLLVSDDGVGLPPSLDIRQTESLGLQLVCTLADQLRGELRIERGAGTAFRLEFDGDA